MLSRHLGFQRVIFDCDSTLVVVEGINELARLKGQAEYIAKLTQDAMNEKITLEEVYAERLERLRPTRAELAEIGRIYRRALVPQAAEVVSALQQAGVEVFILSGGLKSAVLDLAELLRVPAANVYAVSVELDQLKGTWWNYMHHQFTGNPDETYLAFAPTPLAESSGKSALVRNLAADGKRTVMVGDGSTDLVTKDVVRLFIGFGGVERRPGVVEGAEVFLEGPGLAGLLPITLSSYKASKLANTTLWEVFQEGLQEIENGRILFKDESYRQRILRAHKSVNNPEQNFGE
ncbi:MAG: HAD-IB family phosphatase [Anaerolineae bacterium]|nr:HAD-IB family phosphatase [Anaerolineae bacterium]MCI0611062.1 HAD-IB family phosphatase [Anaerolineae bacterium]